MENNDLPFGKRMTFMLLGVLGMGVFLSFLLKVGYGSDTSSFMNTSLAVRFELSFGTLMVLSNGIQLIPEIIWGRKLIGIGTVANMTIIGYTSDFCTMLEEKYLPEIIFTSQPYRSLTFAIALLLFLISAALYMNAGLGLAPFDSIPTMVSSHTHLPFFIVRIIWDFTAILIGVLAGGHLTIGTVILAFTVGPAVSWIGRMMSGKKPCHR